jgi:Leucine-rich repeat (LRR) protein
MKALLFSSLLCIVLQSQAQIYGYWDNPHKVWGVSEENRIKYGAVHLSHAKEGTEKIFYSIKKDEAFPDTIFEFKKLKVITLSSTYNGCCPVIDKVPDKLNSLTKVEYIYFNGIGVQNLPADLSGLTSLKSIYITENNQAGPLMTIPDFSKLPSLRVIFLGLNGKTELAKKERFTSIFSVDSLKVLALYNAQLTANDLANIKNLKQLEILDLGGNKTLTILPDLSSNKKIQQLNFRNSVLEKLNPDIGELQDLRAVDLGYNKLTTLPAEFGKLKKIRYLELSNNLITQLPASMEGLDMLEHLVLRGNDLTEIPEFVYKLKNLKELDLMETRISRLDDRLFDTKISSLAISHKEVGKFSFDADKLAKMKSLKRIQMSTLRAEPDIHKEKQKLKKLRPDISI